MVKATGASEVVASFVGSCGRISSRLDPRSAEKLADIVGLYVNPPEHAWSCQ
jgi:hypothetical protein